MYYSQFEDGYGMKELWCLAFRDATAHGNQTNNFSEVNVQIFNTLATMRVTGVSRRHDTSVPN
ncbi:MULE domain-containing protein, partial [Aphis craccivora]